MKTIHCNIFFRLLFAQIIGAFLYTALFSGNPVSVLLDGDPKPPGIIGIRFSNDGKYFATCAENGLFDIWDFETGALRCAFNLHVKDSMEGWRRTNQTLVKSFFFDWTGQYLYVLSADNGLFLKLNSSVISFATPWHVTYLLQISALATLTLL
jgi:WD40 repeat protein